MKDYYYVSHIYRKETKKMMRICKKKHNAPIATIIRNYKDKKSGKVTTSRKEIQWRFDCLDWKDQKKIMAAFLESGKKDREWAYSQIFDNWDDSFISKVKELWETYHEFKCSWSVIRYFPLEYITEHMDEFTEERDYYYICLRLAKNKEYIIDEERLSKIDYLSVLYHTGRNLTIRKAHDIFFDIVHDCCVNHISITKLEHLGEGKRSDVITPANFREINLAIYYLRKLEKTVILCLFDIWNQMVEEAIFNSIEFKSIKREDILEYEYEQRRINLAKFYAYQLLEDKYKQPSDNSIIENLKYIINISR